MPHDTVPERQDVKLGIYRHYKGTLYEAIALAKHTETGVPLVVYRNRLGEYFARPLEMFWGYVPVAGRHVQRFTFVADTWAQADAEEAGKTCSTPPSA